MMTTIFVAAPKPRTWPLTLDQFAARLTERWPQAEISAHHAPVSNEDYLDFQMDLDGMTRTASYYDRSNLILSDGDPEFWAETIVWFLGLLPADADAVAMVEVNPEYTAPIPPGGDAETIRTLLEGLTEAQ
ncbi:hypothetical protein ACFY1U_45645 [Streptomyces sp. NPDC001351]|uniref:hypothetical protein n=1 Tax=Streptomyces sp. NPDC001351 TaxID=3364564 RepID=UPI0036B3D9F4